MADDLQAEVQAPAARAEPESDAREKRVVKLTLTTTPVVTSASIEREVTNHVTVIRRLPAAIGAGVAGAAPIIGALLRNQLRHHGPLADVADEASKRGGEAAADRILSRSVRIVKRVTTFRS